MASELTPEQREALEAAGYVRSPNHECRWVLCDEFGIAREHVDGEQSTALLADAIIDERKGTP